MGEIDAATLAGIIAAATAQTGSALAASARASGSQKETLYNDGYSRLAGADAPGGVERNEYR